ncbi:basic peroxidase-like [Helianthus annuus]|uniref:basic peroxidase-like n=1 Tax=Helianthus annuus TaxID=4232 RepID=UPI00165330A8|nr:basic peroxidase-like [Helianthus annuus]
MTVAVWMEEGERRRRRGGEEEGERRFCGGEKGGDGEGARVFWGVFVFVVSGKKKERRRVSRQRRMAALIIRLHFHDYFGCDASILLSDPATTERTALSNTGVGGYEVIDAAKSAVENICPGIVSCADIPAVAARDTSVAVGGPSWSVRLGRRDSTRANRALADGLPRADLDLPSLVRDFDAKGLNERDMVA